MAAARANIESLTHNHAFLPDAGDPLWTRARAAFGEEASGAWLATFRRLEEAGGGAGTFHGYLRAGTAVAERLGSEAGIALGGAAAHIAELAGTRATGALIEAAPRALRCLDKAEAFITWLHVVIDMASEAPESIGPMLNHVEALLGELDVAGFRAWVVTGIRSAGGNPLARLEFFTIGDATGAALRARETSDVRFVDVERRMQLFGRALFGLDLGIRGHGKASDQTRRASFDERSIRLPEAFPGFRGERGVTLYSAAVAHSAAHLVFTRVRFPVRTLRPVQIALISLIEDARIEALAMQRFPGLLDFWLPFHEAKPGPDLTAALLIARLARALIDPAFDDPSAWIQKGRRLFLDARADWHDPEISRRIGGLLGNDIGQMRVQFNQKTYVVEPPYRDDNAGLWYFDQEAKQMQEAVVEIGGAMQPANDGGEDEDTTPPPRQPETLPVRPDPHDDAVAEGSAPVARYPEWDHVIGRMHPDWTTVIERQPKRGSSDGIARAIERHAPLVRKISGFLRGIRSGRPERLRRQPEGDRLDLNAAIEACIDLRAGHTPDQRVYGGLERRDRDIAVLILLDASQSTDDTVPGHGVSILRQEREAAALLAQALSEAGDPFAIHAFCSAGRSQVNYIRMKDFEARFDRLTLSRLAGLRAELSTRMGAAIRHAGRLIELRPNFRKLILLVTDGEPSDIDVADRNYLIEDARHAVSELAGRGIDVFCVGLDTQGDDYLRRIFGRRNAVILDRVARLPERLAAIYMRLTR